MTLACHNIRKKWKLLSPFQNIVILISETNFTGKSYLKISNYTVYHTKRPAATILDDIAIIIIEYCIKHHQLNSYSQNVLHTTTVSVEDSIGLLTISAVYLPPKHTVKQEHFEGFYNTLGRRSIAGGDYNVKHTDCGSRLISLKDTNCWKRKKRTRWNTYLTREPIYRPSARNKVLDLVDICVTKNILQHLVLAKSHFDLSSDHSPILVTIKRDALNQGK
jgi:hypothetical protein